jgi:hypothetical protein
MYCILCVDRYLGVPEASTVDYGLLGSMAYFFQNIILRQPTELLDLEFFYFHLIFNKKGNVRPWTIYTEVANLEE